MSSLGIFAKFCVYTYFPSRLSISKENDTHIMLKNSGLLFQKTAIVIQLPVTQKFSNFDTRKVLRDIYMRYLVHTPQTQVIPSQTGLISVVHLSRVVGLAFHLFYESSLWKVY